MEVRSTESGTYEQNRLFFSRRHTALSVLLASNATSWGQRGALPSVGGGRLFFSHDPEWDFCIWIQYSSCFGMQLRVVSVADASPLSMSVGLAMAPHVAPAEQDMLFATHASGNATAGRPRLNTSGSSVCVCVCVRAFVCVCVCACACACAC